MNKFMIVLAVLGGVCAILAKIGHWCIADYYRIAALKDSEGFICSEDARILRDIEKDGGVQGDIRRAKGHLIAAIVLIGIPVIYWLVQLIS